MSWTIGNAYPPGFWTPHSASVDFCESNYLVSHYVVEPWNSLSSLFIVYIAIMGFLYNNPIREKRVALQYIIMATVGIGSCLLHGTLHWLFQSADEVPMLWISVAFLYMIFDIKTPIGQPTGGAVVGFLALASIQTVVYYAFQKFYVAFLVSYLSIAFFLAYWCVRQVNFTETDPKHKVVQIMLVTRTILSYVLLGASLWIAEIFFCHNLTPYYDRAYGLSFHILWHLGAGLGTFYLQSFFLAVRLRHLNKPFAVQFLHGFLPVCTLTTENKKNL